MLACLILLFQGPFEVGYVQTVYTVTEGVGSVRVCINLTKPEVDIEEEMVFVESLDFPTSVYIPADATLASEFSRLRCGDFLPNFPFSARSF